MGHTRLGSIPTTQKWSAVVAAIMGGGSGGGDGGSVPAEHVGQIASQALEAARAGLDRAVSDPGLQHTFYLLTQLVLAARQPDWEPRLSQLGIHLASTATLFDLTAEMQAVVDDHMGSYGPPSDIGEMAQQSAGEALAVLAGSHSVTLFGGGSEALKAALYPLSTAKGFSQLGQRFFASFMGRFLNFYLSRVTAAQVGGTRWHQVGDVSRFNEELRAHCMQSAQIVTSFCGEWYSKTEYREGIDPGNAARFMAVAMRKLQAELARQGVQE